VKTSHTHPLQIAEIPAGQGLGRIGVTFCPGKKDPAAMSGAWDRDLGLDLEVIRAWGASAVVTLVEEYELELLRVPTLGKAVRERHMAWLHLPIRDVSVPNGEFERRWALQGPGLRHRLVSGFDVLVHCRGGLGRAGTIASRLLAELGWDPARCSDSRSGMRSEPRSSSRLATAVRRSRTWWAVGRSRWSRASGPTTRRWRSRWRTA
jgi:ADP-ribosyl-[dinitrogen reductase] hydrolase